VETLVTIAAPDSEELNKDDPAALVEARANA